MDDGTQELKSYINNLMPAVKTAVLSSEWHRRANEIGVKYSLTPEQENSLEYEILFVLIGMEPEEDLVTNIQNAVGVSKILATQIADEVNGRIFQYIAKLVGAKELEKPASAVPKDISSASPITKPITQTSAQKVSAPQYSAPLRDPYVKPTNSGLLSEIETIANGPIQKNDMIKVAEPPANLPGEVVLQGVSTPHIAQPEPTGTDIKPGPKQPPVSPLEPTPDFSSLKPNETLPKENVPEASPKAGYSGADPYREPIE